MLAQPGRAAATDADAPPKRAGSYRSWAELLARTFKIDVLECAMSFMRGRMIRGEVRAAVEQRRGAAGR